jgi:hypothetical protein
VCIERSGTMCDDVHESVIIKAEVTDMDIKVEEMSVVKVEEDIGMNIKKEEIPVVRFEEETLIDAKKEDIHWDVTSPTIKAEQYQVSCMCVCPLLDTFYEYPIMCTIFCHLQLCLSDCTKLLHCCEWKHFCFCYCVVCN